MPICPGGCNRELVVKRPEIGALKTDICDCCYYDRYALEPSEAAYFANHRDFWKTVATGMLLPCPFCGGAAEIDARYMSPSMSGRPGALISASVRHHCEKLKGTVGASIEFRGREIPNAIMQWNQRK